MCLSRVAGVRWLFFSVEQARAEKYSQDNPTRYLVSHNQFFTLGGWGGGEWNHGLEHFVAKASTPIAKKCERYHIERVVVHYNIIM